MATQENIPVIRHPRANKCSRFRIHWNVNTFYLLFRSDKVFNWTIHRTYFPHYGGDLWCLKGKGISLWPVPVTRRTMCAAWNRKSSRVGASEHSSIACSRYWTQNFSYSISLKLAKYRAGMRHDAVMCTRLWTLAAQEYSPIIGHSSADNRDQFRIYWYWNDNMLKQKSKIAKNGRVRTH